MQYKIVILTLHICLMALACKTTGLVLVFASRTTEFGLGGLAFKMLVSVPSLEVVS